MAKDFNLTQGVAKLEDAAKVEILPAGIVNFDFTFRRNGGPAAPQAPAPKTVTQETAGNFDSDACLGRFEILSRAGNINFAAGRAVLTQDSRTILLDIADIIKRCPRMNIQVQGHTDSDGKATSNMRLSRLRAQAVVAFLTSNGASWERLKAVGLGETQPVVPNSSAANKRKNRRITFVAQGF